MAAENPPAIRPDREDLTASMRPRRMAAENRRLGVRLRHGARASMRPRRMAAENAGAGAGAGWVSVSLQ